MSTLSEFINAVKYDGIAKTNRYKISFTKPKILNQNNELQRKLEMFCCQTQLPGVNISTFQSRTFGETREIPYERLFDNVNFTFYVDRKMLIKTFFDSWINGIQDSRTRAFNFYKDYITDIKIQVLDNEDNIMYGVTLYECYPKTLAPISLGYDQKDAMQIQVSMNYKYWEASSYTNTVEVVTDKVTGITTGRVNNIQEFAVLDFSLPDPQIYAGIFEVPSDLGDFFG
jgi:hypothetical protein